MNTIVHHNALLTPLCVVISLYNPSFCAMHTDCDRVKHGYKHKGNNCDCMKVQVADE